MLGEKNKVHLFDKTSWRCYSLSMNTDTLIRYALRTTDLAGAVKYYGGKNNYYFNSDGLLSNAEMFIARKSAVSIINNRKRMSKTGPNDWMIALDMWNRVEIVTVEVSLKII